MWEEEDEDSGKEAAPQQRNAANARERARMRILSKAFNRLKMTLPWVPPDTKLSKLDTLRLATSYIAHLKAVLKLADRDPAAVEVTHPVNLSWPFAFNGEKSSDSAMAVPEVGNWTDSSSTTIVGTTSGAAFGGNSENIFSTAAAAAAAVHNHRDRPIFQEGGYHPETRQFQNYCANTVV